MQKPQNPPSSLPRAPAPPRGGRGAASGALLRGGAGASRAVTLTRSCWAAAAPSSAPAPSMGAPPETPRPDPGLSRAGPPMQSRSSTRANIKWFPRGVEAAGVPPAAVPPPLSTIFFSSSACDAQKKNNLREVLRFFAGVLTRF